MLSVEAQDLLFVVLGLLGVAFSWLVENWRVLAALLGGLAVLHALSYISSQLAELNARLILIRDVLRETQTKLNDDPPSRSERDTLSVLEDIRDELRSMNSAKHDSLEF